MFQGTVLGPILFMIHINDLPDVLDSECGIFADNVKIFNECNEKSSVYPIDFYGGCVRPVGPLLEIDSREDRNCRRMTEVVIRRQEY